MVGEGQPEKTLVLPSATTQVWNAITLHRDPAGSTANDAASVKEIAFFPPGPDL
jgi:hypothetical protein